VRTDQRTFLVIFPALGRPLMVALPAAVCYNVRKESISHAYCSCVCALHRRERREGGRAAKREGGAYRSCNHFVDCVCGRGLCEYAKKMDILQLFSAIRGWWWKLGCVREIACEDFQRLCGKCRTLTRMPKSCLTFETWILQTRHHLCQSNFDFDFDFDYSKQSLCHVVRWFDRSRSVRRPPNQD